MWDSKDCSKLQQNPSAIAAYKRSKAIMEDLLQLPELSWEEIRKHTDTQSCWCVFYGLVYDLTKFLKQHPGGHHVILEVAGIGMNYMSIIRLLASFIGFVSVGRRAAISSLLKSGIAVTHIAYT